MSLNDPRDDYDSFVRRTVSDSKTVALQCSLTTKKFGERKYIPIDHKTGKIDAHAIFSTKNSESTQTVLAMSVAALEAAKRSKCDIEHCTHRIGDSKRPKTSDFPSDFSSVMSMFSGDILRSTVKSSTTTTEVCSEYVPINYEDGNIELHSRYSQQEHRRNQEIMNNAFEAQKNAKMALDLFNYT